jgi:hypothetical protein
MMQKLVGVLTVFGEVLLVAVDEFQCRMYSPMKSKVLRKYVLPTITVASFRAAYTLNDQPAF